MSNAEIAKAMGFSRMHVHNITVKALTKIYKKVQNNNRDWSGFDVFQSMVLGFNLRAHGDVESLFRLLPIYIQRAIKDSAIYIGECKMNDRL